MAAPAMVCSHPSHVRHLVNNGINNLIANVLKFTEHTRWHAEVSGAKIYRDGFLPKAERCSIHSTEDVADQLH